MKAFEWTDDLVKEFMGRFATIYSLDEQKTLFNEFKAKKLLNWDLLEKRMTPAEQPKPEWEIVSISHPAVPREGITLVGNDRFRCNGKKVSEEEWLKISGCKIHSVKRLSDGEVFTVGDWINIVGASFEHKISGFSVEDDKMLVAFEGVERRHMEYIRKPFLTKENRDFLADLGSERVKLAPDEAIPAAANGKVPVWLMPYQVEILEYMIGKQQDGIAFPKENM